MEALAFGLAADLFRLALLKLLGASAISASAVPEGHARAGGQSDSVGHPQPFYVCNSLRIPLRGYPFGVGGMRDGASGRGGGWYPI